MAKIKSGSVYFGVVLWGGLNTATQTLDRDDFLGTEDSVEGVKVCVELNVICDVSFDIDIEVIEFLPQIAELLLQLVYFVLQYHIIFGDILLIRLRFDLLYEVVDVKILQGSCNTLFEIYECLCLLDDVLQVLSKFFEVFIIKKIDWRGELLDESDNFI